MNGLIILHPQNIRKSLQNLLARNMHFLFIMLKQQLCLLMKYIDDDIWVSQWVFLSIAMWPTLNVVHFPRSAALLLRVGLMKMMKQTPTTKPATLTVHFVRSKGGWGGGGDGIPLESSSRACSRTVQANHHQMIYTWKDFCELFRIFWAKVLPYRSSNVFLADNMKAHFWTLSISCDGSQTITLPSRIRPIA